MKRILFICLGNICRSPMAEAVMKRMVDEAGLTAEFEIDSAGLISYHEGEEADPRMQTHARRHGYRLTHRSRPIRESDFHHFDLIIGMDDSNIDRLRRLSPDAETAQKIHQISEYFINMQADHVPDPYYGGSEGFEHVIELLEDACQGLIIHHSNS
ncbi:MAG: low molecular weight phosphotyrosine protein phosphatase [Bacteroidaceae bacterium]|nr:low molecular weight phosphotyrosine protein phosphatase [Bacteroidaceae bacterium]